MLNAFSQSQLQALPTLSTLTTTDLQNLAASTWSTFSAQQTATLTRAQLASLTPQQVTELNSAAWALFDAAQVNGLTLQQLAAVPQTSIGAISSSAIQGLSIGGNLQPYFSSPRPSEASAAPLSAVSGNVAQISTNGTIAVAISTVSASTGDTGAAYLWNGSAWNALPGTWKQVQVGSDGSIWGISNNGEIERYVVNQWVDEGASAGDIAAGSDGSLLAVSMNGNLLDWNSGSWSNLGGSLSKIAVGADGSLWAIGTDGNVYQYQSLDPRRYTAGRWADQSLSGATAIAAGGDGDVFVLGAQNVAGGNVYESSGSGTWLVSSQVLSSVEVDPSGAVFGVDSGGNILQQYVDGSWGPTSDTPVGYYSYYGSANAEQNASAQTAWNAANAVAQAFIAGGTNLEAAGQALLSSLDAIASQDATQSQIFALNGLANALEYGNADGATQLACANNTLEGANAIASLLGALILNGGYDADETALAFLSVGGAMAIAAGESTINQLSSAFQQSESPTFNAVADLNIDPTIGLSGSFSSNYSTIAAALTQTAGSPNAIVTALDTLLSQYSANVELEDEGQAAVSGLSGAQVQSLTTASITTFTPEQIAAFTAAQISLLNASQLNALLPQQIAMFSADQIAGISSGIVSGLSSGFLSSLSEQQVAALGNSQLAELSSQQIADLTGVFIAGLSSEQMTGLSSTQLGNFNADQINDLSTSQVLALSSSQIASFEPSAVKHSLLYQGGGGLGSSSNGASFTLTGTGGDVGDDPFPLGPFHTAKYSVWVSTKASIPAGDLKWLEENVDWGTTTPQQVLNILNGQNLQVQLMAHWVIEPGVGALNAIHTWINISSNVNGNYQSYTLSFEPVGRYLTAKFDADNQITNGATPGGENCINPLTLSPPSASGLTTQQFAIQLTNFFIAYTNHVLYSYTPFANTEQFNSNSGTAALLQLAKINTANMKVTFSNNPINNNPSDTANDFQFSGKTVPLAPSWQDLAFNIKPYYGLAPGWGNSLVADPYEDSFDYTRPGILQEVDTQTTTNPAAELFNSPYVRDIVLTNPNLSGAFTGNLGALSDLVVGIESIKAGGVVNVLSGGLDLAEAGVQLGIIPATIGGVPIEQYLDEVGQGIASYEDAVTVIGDVESIYNDFEQGGVWGAVEGAMTAYSLPLDVANFLTSDFVTSIIGDGASGAIEAFAASAALPVAIAVGLVILLFGGHHDNPADMPDKYDTTRFTDYTGELQGHSATAYGPAYNPQTDVVQRGLGGLSMLEYIEDWVAANINSPIAEVKKLASQLDSLYGDTGGGQLAFQHDIANESVVGGSLSGTYVSLWDASNQAVGEIQAVTAVVDPPPSPTYGGLEWTAFMLPDGSYGYWTGAQNGQYYYFGPDGNLYVDDYPGEVQPGDATSDLIGNVATYNFPPPPAAPQPAQDYGDLIWTPFMLANGETGFWAQDPNSSGEYYYFGPDNALYLDPYPGPVHQTDTASNVVGNVTTYQFAS